MVCADHGSEDDNTLLGQLTPPSGAASTVNDVTSAAPDPAESQSFPPEAAPTPPAGPRSKPLVVSPAPFTSTPPPALPLRPHRGARKRKINDSAAHSRYRQFRPSLLGAQNAIGQSGLSLVRRFERLPRSHQIAWIALPYAAAFALVVSLYLSRIEPVKVASRTSSTTEPARVRALPSPRYSDELLALSTRVITLSRASALFVRPN
ncbi:MAG: hypothetical protein AAF449_03460, partial [Myxococcota bacterium]